MPLNSHCDKGPASRPTRSSGHVGSLSNSHQILRMARHLQLTADLARFVDDAHRRLFDRNVQTGIIFHAALLLRCLWLPHSRPRLSSACMAAAAHRRAIEGERQYLTLRQTLRTVPMTFSMMLVQASERRSSRGRPSLVTVSISSIPSRIEAETPFQSRSRRRARLRMSVSAFSASAPQPKAGIATAGRIYHLIQSEIIRL